MKCNWLALGALSGALTVALGAFGAHALKERLTADQLDIWRTAVQYQGLHALALGLVGLWVARSGRGAGAGWGFAVGTVLFSGSLYALALGGPRVLGAITPVGGVAFMLGWVLLALAARGAGTAEMAAARTKPTAASGVEGPAAAAPRTR